MKLTLRILGIPLVSLSLSGLQFGSAAEEEYISNTGGSFELAPDEVYEDEDYYEEDRVGFGFGLH